MFLFLLAKAALAYLPTVHSKALRPLFSFRQAQYVQVFPLKPAPFCKLFAGLGSTKSVISLPFYSSLILALSSSLCPFLCVFFTLISLADLAGTLFPPVLSGYNGCPDTCFSRGMTQLMSWSDGERCSCPLYSHVVYLFTYLPYPLLFFLELEAYCLI